MTDDLASAMGTLGRECERSSKEDLSVELGLRGHQGQTRFIMTDCHAHLRPHSTSLKLEKPHKKPTRGRKMMLNVTH
jgi:hypothetical protein